MCSQSYIHQIDTLAHVQAARYVLTYGEWAIDKATEMEDCRQYRQRVVDSITTIQALKAAAE